MKKRDHSKYMYAVGLVVGLLSGLISVFTAILLISYLDATSSRILVITFSLAAGLLFGIFATAIMQKIV